jgi:hypothetical protein
MSFQSHPTVLISQYLRLTYCFGKALRALHWRPIPHRHSSFHGFIVFFVTNFWCAVWEAAFWGDSGVERGGLCRCLVCGQPPGGSGWAPVPGAGGIRLLLPPGVLPGPTAHLRTFSFGHSPVCPNPPTRSLMMHVHCNWTQKIL